MTDLPTWVDEFFVADELDTDNTKVFQTHDEVLARDTSTMVIGDTFPIDDNTSVTVDLQVVAIAPQAAGKKVFNIRREYINAAGTITEGAQTNLLGPTTLGSSPPAASVSITRTGKVGRIEISGAIARYRIDRQVVIVPMPTGALPSPPLSLTPTTGPSGGGTAVVITVASSAGMTGAKIGGVALTSFSVDDATHVSGVTGAHAVGASDVTTSNTYGESNPLVGGFAYTFNPAAETLKAYWIADGTEYNGSPWPGTASAGSSGSQSLSEATNPPTTGTAVSGKVPARYDGVNDQLLAAAASNFFAVGGYTWGGLFKVLTAPAQTHAIGSTCYANETIFVDANADIGCFIRNLAGVYKVQAYHASGGGATEEGCEATISVGSYFFVAARYTAGSPGKIELFINGVLVASDLSVANVALLSGAVQFAKTYGGALFANFEQLAFFSYDTAVADAKITGWYSFLKSTFPGASLP